MAYRLSPGVYTSEIDLTTVVPAVGTSTGAYAGNFAWGPVEEIRIIDSEVRLVDTFWKPDSNTYVDFLTSANFLAYSSDLRVVRAANTSARNATSNGSAILVKNETDYEQNRSTGGSSKFIAKYAGTLGNSIGVSVADSNTYTGWTYSDEFTTAPDTSDYATSKNSSNDELHIVVYDTTGKISGTANTILEKFAFVSKASDAKNSDGTSNYYKDVINSRSKWLWWSSHVDGSDWGDTTSNQSGFDDMTSVYTASLSGGVNGTLTDGDIIRAYEMFANADAVDVSLIMTGSHSDTVKDSVITLAETRGDALAFVSPELSNVVDNIGSEATDIVTTRNNLTSSSYAVMDSGWKYQYDKYNDTYRWIPLNADLAGLCAYTDNVRDAWFSPAGLNRGLIRNVVKLSWNPTQTERDTLYKNGVNPVCTFPGEGTVLWGDKTLLSRPSAFDRINVRRLFIVLRRAISKAARSTLFEFNDEFTRAQFVSLVEPFLRDVQGRRGVYDFRVVCDTTNNTGEVIDRNEFVGDIYIKPARSINYIQLNFVAVRTGVSFDEIVGKF